MVVDSHMFDINEQAKRRHAEVLDKLIRLAKKNQQMRIEIEQLKKPWYKRIFS